MTTTPCLLHQTTSTGQPDEVTRRLVSMIEDADCHLQDIARQIDLGADLHIECGDYDAGDGREWTNLTAMSLAVVIDSDGHQLLLTPLLLAHGGDVRQVDSKGRTLLSFAWQGPVASYLHEQGALQEPWVVDALAAMEDADAVFDLAIDEPLVPDAERNTLLPDWFVEELVAVGFSVTEDVRTSPTIPRRHPLVARFSAARVLASAVYARDAGRINRLIELGGHTVDVRDDYDVERGGETYFFRDLTVLGLAVLVDGEAGGDDGFGEPEGEPCAVPPFAQVMDFSGAHDMHGNTLLHMAKSPRMVEWLLRFGLSLDVLNDDGQSPLDVATPATRSVMEQWVLEQHLEGDVKGATAQKRL